jgi:hemoglobin
MTHEDWIFQVVKSFYDKARTDVLIGYHFRIIPDFETHIPRIAAFWEIQLLGSTSKKLSEPFDVMKVHVPLGIKRGELGRWLLLFKKTLDEQTSTEFESLKELWLERLNFFEGVFLRFFGFQS